MTTLNFPFLSDWRAEIENELAALRTEIATANDEVVASQETARVAVMERGRLWNFFELLGQQGGIASALHDRRHHLESVFRDAEGWRRRAQNALSELRRREADLEAALAQLNHPGLSVDQTGQLREVEAVDV